MLLEAIEEYSLLRTNGFRGGCMQKKVLIIEDNAENLELFCTVLKCGGYEPLLARNGKEGVKVAMEAQPHLILMDIQMPVMNGYDAIKILKSEASTRDIPSIAITAEQLKGGRDDFIQYGFDDFIPKPIKLREFIEVIDRHLEKSLHA
jgi:two-component system, cell cycle response regulator DivK